MIISTQKAQRQLKDLEQLLDYRFASEGISGADSFDANGNPVVLFSNGTPVTNGRNILLTIKQQDAISKDIFGNQLLAYNNELVQIVYELSSAVSISDAVTLMIEVGKLGYIVELYARANGAVPSVADIIPGNLLTHLEYSILAPAKGN